nr:T9SS type A sorting domain-containing protein [Chitinophagaceae bacterium]
PNPTQGILNIAYFMLQEGISKIKLSDMSGRILREIQVNSNKGINTFQLEVNELAKGMYMLQTIRSGQEISTQKFEKQ